VDWTDAEQLRNLLYNRVTHSIAENDRDRVWAAFNTGCAEGGDTVSRLIEGSLRRPRFLIDLSERVLSFAINRGHLVVTEDDVEDGLRQMALYLVSDFGYEMRDVAGTPEDIFNFFIGTEPILSEDDILILLSEDKLGIGIPETVDLLLWYGFLGLVGPLGGTTFIYDLNYDFKRLDTERCRLNPVKYAVNPAFLRGLESRR
jgi:hypothetical protein